MAEPPSHSFPYSSPGPLDPNYQNTFDDMPLTIPLNKSIPTDGRQLEPWEPPPAYPKRGGPTHTRVYQAVGFALSQWEELEARFGLLHLRLLGLEYHPDGKSAAKKYQDAVGTMGRLDELAKAAEHYALFVHDQSFEAEFVQITSETRLFILRRNDIAHGAARQVDRNLVLNGEVIHDKCGYCLVPISMIDRFLQADAKREFHIYSPADITFYGNEFRKLRRRLENFISKLTIIEKSSP